jgi:hypothetical protein
MEFTIPDKNASMMEELEELVGRGLDALADAHCWGGGEETNQLEVEEVTVAASAPAATTPRKDNNQRMKLERERKTTKTTSKKRKKTKTRPQMKKKQKVPKKPIKILSDEEEAEGAEEANQNFVGTGKHSMSSIEGKHSMSSIDRLLDEDHPSNLPCYRHPSSLPNRADSLR